MKALEVFINGHRVCLAGVGDDGVLNAIVNSIGNPKREDDIFLSVGGLDCVTDEHLRWESPSIGVGAEVLVRVIEAAEVDPPSERIRSTEMWPCAASATSSSSWRRVRFILASTLPTCPITSSRYESTLPARRTRLNPGVPSPSISRSRASSSGAR